MSGWYPKFTPDAQHILSGAGGIFLDGQPLLEHGEPVVGWQPHAAERPLLRLQRRA
jgi:hypothetical protein